MNRRIGQTLATHRVVHASRGSTSVSDTTTGPQPVRKLSREVACIPHPREPTVLIVACGVCGEYQPVCPVGCEQGGLVLALTAPWVVQFIVNHHRWCGPKPDVRSEWTYNPHAAKAPRA